MTTLLSSLKIYYKTSRRQVLLLRAGMNVQSTFSEFPVILHKTLANSEYKKLLNECNYKVRESERTIENTCIFPMSNVAFIITKTGSASFTQSRDYEWKFSQHFVDTVERFTQIHRRCYLLLETGAVTSVDEEDERRLWHRLQLRYQYETIRYLKEKINLLSCPSPYDTVTAMTGMAKALCKPTSCKLHERLLSLHPNVHELNEATFHRALTAIGVPASHVCQIQDGVGSMSHLASASHLQLSDCGIDTPTAKFITLFFSQASRQDYS